MPASASVKNLYPSLGRIASDELSAQLSTAESYVEALLGRKISCQACVDTFDGQNYPLLKLKNFPVRSVEKIVFNSNGVLTEYTSASGYFRWSEKGDVVLQNYGFIDHMAGFPAGVFNIQVHYTNQGLSQSEQDRLIGGVAYWNLSQNTINPTLTSETIGAYSYSQASGTGSKDASAIPLFIQTLIAPYRRYRAL